MMDWTETKRSYPMSMRRIVSTGTLCVVRLHRNKNKHVQTDPRFKTEIPSQNVGEKYSPHHTSKTDATVIPSLSLTSPVL